VHRHPLVRILRFATIASIPAILSAQSGSSAIAGMVRDSSGAAISSACPARTVQLGLRLGF
jgi:hypothetical protein